MCCEVKYLRYGAEGKPKMVSVLLNWKKNSPKWTVGMPKAMLFNFSVVLASKRTYTIN